ncbi:MAG: hypothetical protein LRY63_09925 [Nitrincola sp.]|nr:hypothetical protein [Nitrincola sp.]
MTCLFFILIGPALFYWLMLGVQHARQALLIGWSFGFGLFGAGVSWVWVSIHVYGYTSVPIATLATLLFVAGLAILFAAQAWLFFDSFLNAPMPG